MVLSVLSGATQYIYGNLLKQRLLRYFKEKSEKLRLFSNAFFVRVKALLQRVQSFPFKMTYWAVVSSIQGLFNKIPVLFLQIQGVFKEKAIFKEFSRTEQYFHEYSWPVRTMNYKSTKFV